MKHSQKMSGVRIARAASTFSLILLISAGWAGPYRDLDAKLSRAHTAAEKLRILKNNPISGDDDLSDRVADASEGGSNVETAVQMVNLKAMAESAGATPDQSKVVKNFKASPLYKDTGKTEDANWLSGAIERIKNIRWFRLSPPRVDGRAPSPILGLGAIGAFLIAFVWFLLGAAIIAFIVYAVRLVRFGKLKKRGAKAMLEDDEPERTLDEWLALADSLEREGKIREAVRALYLACLLKFDERNIARFVRSQTNWEHLSRIEASPRRPAGLDFRTPTQAFDQIWYGHKVRGHVDVDDFRAWYRQVSTLVSEAAA